MQRLFLGRTNLTGNTGCLWGKELRTKIKDRGGFTSFYSLICTNWVAFIKKKIAWACITFKSSPLGLVKQKVTDLIRLISHPKFYILSVEENGIKSHFFFWWQNNICQSWKDEIQQNFIEFLNSLILRGCGDPQLIPALCLSLRHKGVHMPNTFLPCWVIWDKGLKCAKPPFFHL